jgi:hypothetical protein
LPGVALRCAALFGLSGAYYSAIAESASTAARGLTRFFRDMTELAGTERLLANPATSDVGLKKAGAIGQYYA